MFFEKQNIIRFPIERVKPCKPTSHTPIICFGAYQRQWATSHAPNLEARPLAKVLYMNSAARLNHELKE